MAAHSYENAPVAAWVSPGPSQALAQSQLCTFRQSSATRPSATNHRNRPMAAADTTARWRCKGQLLPSRIVAVLKLLVLHNATILTIRMELSRNLCFSEPVSVLLPGQSIQRPGTPELPSRKTKHRQAVKSDANEIRSKASQCRGIHNSSSLGKRMPAQLLVPGKTTSFQWDHSSKTPGNQGQ